MSLQKKLCDSESWLLRPRPKLDCCEIDFNNFNSRKISDVVLGTVHTNQLKNVWMDFETDGKTFRNSCENRYLMSGTTKNG